MHKLKSLLESIDEPEEQVSFAKSCGTSLGYMKKIMYTRKRLFFGPAICAKIEIKTNGLINRKDLRPHDWQEVWPELAEQEVSNGK